MLEHDVGQLNSICSVECALSNLGDERGVWEGQGFEICGILIETNVRLGNENTIEIERTGVGISAPVIRSTGASR